MITAIDTNIFLDLLLNDPEYKDKAREYIKDSNRKGSTIICELVYAELSNFFSKRKGHLDDFLSDLNVILVSSTEKSLYSAGISWSNYLKKRYKGIQCSRCGDKMLISCSNCGENISKKHILSDFIIAAHAIELADTLVTRDQGIFKTYFPGLSLNFG